ncbi:MAG TPA: glutathione S-transferase family protein [Hyphomonadaceae bacterium]|nr:glutathione S-transferase family protein [Hyphomonadaceae bacterium]
MSQPYTLYYSPGTASLCVHWMLVHLGVPHGLIKLDMDAGAQKTPDYLKLNPAGRIPTLIVDGQPRFESTALLMLLAERHPEAGLAPPVGSPDRADWLVEMVYLANNLLPAFRDWFYAAKDGASDAEAVRALARKRIEEIFDRLDQRLSDGRKHLVGANLSTVDLLATMLMRWSRNMPRPATSWPNLTRYITAMRALPSFIATCDREDLTEWRNP